VSVVLNQQHLEWVLDVFVDQYNGHRPHRALALNPPHPTHPPVAGLYSSSWHSDTAVSKEVP